MKWSRKHTSAAGDEARRLREEAERAEADAAARVVLPLRRMRAENHVVEAIIRIVRREPGDPGTAR